MKLSYQWLKELTGCKLSPEKMAEILNLHVAALEGFKKIGEGLEKIIVVEIVEIKKHPQADKLQLVKVNAGSEKYNIVCGAFNIKVGDKVPLALPGAKLPNGMEIKKTVIRGEKSVGMLCAEDELGLGDDHLGILILDKKLKPGEKIPKALGLDDIIFEIETVALTHRPDLFGHLGFVKEIIALTKSKIKKEKIKSKLKIRKEKTLKIKIENYKDCSRYMGVIIDDVQIKPSPTWLQNRLRNLGIRPIDNIVDITNLILLEIGQPLHAFDFDKLDGGSTKSKIINIRRAKLGEKIITLDGEEKKLDKDVLVIADTKKPIALAGIMGGEDSGINKKTKTIVIESANFNPTVTRIAAKKVGLRTEANIRFEKGLPLIFTEQGIQRVIELIIELTGGKIVSQIYDIKDKKTEKLLRTKKTINLNLREINDLIGEEISTSEIIRYLSPLGFDVCGTGEKILLKIPSDRPDIEYPEDVIEEVARLYGYYKIEPRAIEGQILFNQSQPVLKIERSIKNKMIGLGFDEVYNYSFYGEKLIKGLKIKLSDHLELANPLNPDQRYLRLSLLPELLENASKNVKNFEEFRIFETGRIFKKKEINIDQEKFLGGLVLERGKDIFRQLKGLVEKILDKENINPKKISYQSSQHHNYQYLNNLVGLMINNQAVGLLGILDEKTKNDFKLVGQVGLFEINLERLSELKADVKFYKKISIYPSITRDLALIIPKSIIFDEVMKTINNFDNLIYSVETFDVFESEKIGKNNRSIAVRITFQSFEKTLESEEIDKIINRLVKNLEQKLQIKLRNF